MRHRKVSDLMTTSVVSVPPEASFKEIVATLADADVTGVPVLDADNRPVGVVTESDLVRGESRQPDPTGVLDASAAGAGGDRARRATTAAGLMTSPAVVARPEWTVVQAARTMDTRQVKRLPVVDESDRLVGIVSLADLLRVFLRKDRAIAEEIRGDIAERTLHLAPGEVSVTVADGCVTLRGSVEEAATVPLLVRLCEGVDGVVAVTEELGFREGADAHPVRAGRSAG